MQAVQNRRGRPVYSARRARQIFTGGLARGLTARILGAGGRPSKSLRFREVIMKRIAHLFAACLLLSLPAAAHTPQPPPHQLFGEGDLKLESGEAIRDFSISYVTHGTLNAKKSNAILMVTAISGNHHRIDFMIGPGKALGPEKYFIVCTDAIANGFSTSPSNSRAQPRMQFPKFTIRDMVESQYRLMKEKLGIDHVVAVIGPSMGGMQVLQWGVPSRLHGRAGGDGAAGEDAGLERGGDGSLAQGDHERSGLEGRQLRSAAEKGRASVARHS
jgi:hypothetical protein